MAAIADQAAAAGYDYLGASFGASEELLSFWRGHGLWPVRFGLTRNHASGTHSAMVMRALSTRGRGLMNQARSAFARDLPHQLADPLCTLEPGLAARVLARGADEAAPVALLAPAEWAEVSAFVAGRRGYEVTMAPIWQLVVAVLPGAQAAMTPDQRDAVVAKVLQRRAWSEVAGLLGVKGQGAAIAVVRQGIQALLALRE